MANKFKLGDIVKCTCTYIGNECVKGQTGTVCRVYGDGDYGIDFGKDVNGHDCAHTCIDRHGWAIPAKYLESAIPKKAKVLIYHTENTVIAKLLDGKTVLAQGEARCSQNDTFNLLTGAQIAICVLQECSMLNLLSLKKLLRALKLFKYTNKENI